MKVENLTSWFVESLVMAIVSGELPEAEQLPSEAEIAERFGVSRTITREGIGVVSSLGLITKKQGKKSRIADRQEWDYLSPFVIKALLTKESDRDGLLNALFDIRLLVEGHAASEAALRRTDDDVKRMRFLLEELIRSEVKPPDRAHADEALHTCIHEAMHNPVFSSLLRKLQEMLVIAREHMTVAPRDETVQERQHSRIVDAIAVGDPEEARTAMEEHLRWVKEQSLS